MSEIQKLPRVKNSGKTTNREMISTVFFNVLFRWISLWSKWFSVVYSTFKLMNQLSLLMIKYCCHKTNLVIV